MEKATKRLKVQYPFAFPMQVDTYLLIDFDNYWFCYYYSSFLITHFLIYYVIHLFPRYNAGEYIRLYIAIIIKCINSETSNCTTIQSDNQQLINDVPHNYREIVS